MSVTPPWMAPYGSAAPPGLGGTPSPGVFSSFSAPPPVATAKVLHHTIQDKAQSVAALLGALLVARLLHRLPGQVTSGKRFWLPPDWKVAARVLLGISALHRVNKAFDWQPPPWLAGGMAVALITPLTTPVFSRKVLAQAVVMAPLVGALAQGAQGLQGLLADPLKERLHVPRFVTRLGLSLGMAAAGLRLYPGLFRQVAETGLLGKSLRAHAETGAAALAGSLAPTCARGCTPGSLVCMSEVGEMLGGLGFHPKTATPEINPETNQERR